MKKLSKINLQNATELQDEEMRLIFGGSGSGGGTCGFIVEIWEYNDFDPDTTPEPGTFLWTQCGVSKADVDSVRPLAVPGGVFRWCCDSCAQSSYCG